MAQTAAHLIDHVIPRVPVRQWVMPLPIPLRLLLASQPELVTPVLQVVPRAITRFLLDQAGLKAEQADGGAVTLILRFGSAANLNIHLHCLILDGVYRRTGGEPEFVEVPGPTDEALQALLRKIIARLMKLLTRPGVLVEGEGSTYLADSNRDSDDARTLRPLQAAACTYRIAFGPRAGQKVFRVQGACRAMPRSPRRCVQPSRGSACTPPCAAAPTSASGWSSRAATSPARRWPTSGCNAMAWCSST